MVRMSDVWDRTTEVLRGRLSMLATIAALLVFLPTLAQAAAQLFFDGNDLVGLAAGRTGVTELLTAALGLIAVGFGVVVVRVWGSAALIAAGSDPRYDQGAAMAHGARRILALIGVYCLVLLGALVLLLPFFGLLGASFDWLALARGQALDPSSLVPSFGTIAGAILYLLFIALPVFVFFAVRLTLLAPVIVNERLGAGAIGRAWELTRGIFWPLFGVLLLFGLVFGIASIAATMILGLPARLIMGEAHAAGATFFGQIGTAAVTAAYAVVLDVFTAQLYRARTGREAAETFA